MFAYITLEPQKIDWAATGAMVAALATIILAGIAWQQLSKMSKIAKADFVHRFKKDFFSDDTRLLFDLFDDDLIVFKREKVKEDAGTEWLWFEVDLDRAHRRPFRTMERKKDTYSCSEIDDLLLGHFEDIGLFHKQGLMDIEFIYEGYDFYIELIHENEQIKEYIKWNRSQPGGQDIYDGFDYIYGEGQGIWQQETEKVLFVIAEGTTTI